jgi:hypothetical protein
MCSGKLQSSCIIWKWNYMNGITKEPHSPSFMAAHHMQMLNLDLLVQQQFYQSPWLGTCKIITTVVCKLYSVHRWFQIEPFHWTEERKLYIHSLLMVWLWTSSQTRIFTIHDVILSPVYVPPAVMLNVHFAIVVCFIQFSQQTVIVSPNNITQWRYIAWT